MKPKTAFLPMSSASIRSLAMLGLAGTPKDKKYSSMSSKLELKGLVKPETASIDFELKKVLLPLLGNFADILYLKENFKPHLLRDVCTLCSGALVSDSLLHMLL